MNIVKLSRLATFTDVLQLFTVNKNRQQIDFCGDFENYI